MREPSKNSLKAWAREYNEAPFYFVQTFKQGVRLVAWSDEPRQIKTAFYQLVDLLPVTVEVLLKISVGTEGNGPRNWSRFHAKIGRRDFSRVVRENEDYVFSDGMHQLCVKDSKSAHFLTFDDHGIFYIYLHTPADVEVFRSLDFEPRSAEPIYSIPHFQHVSPNSETLEMKFVTELGLERANSDLD